MQTLLYHATTIAALAVFVVLLLGISTLVRKDSANLSQKLMRWRIGLQFAAIVVIMLFVYFSRA